jgi:competence protein ComEC
MVLLTTIALLTGFILLLVALVSSTAAQIAALPVKWSLMACDALVGTSESWLGAFVYVSDIPAWWLWGFYLGLLALLVFESARRQWRWLTAAGLVWLCVGLLFDAHQQATRGFRCTFLAVGHGGCTVIETPDGRTLLYDAGSMKGPDVTRRHIAPFLWHRGIRRIDELFVSHADLDHFNGLPSLLERFAVGQVTSTPSFAERGSPGVAVTLEALTRRGIPFRTVKAGDRLMSGSLRMEVLHPPAEGPSGNENARSMVLLLEHRGQTILLTGDLEGLGLSQFLNLQPRPVDVLMAPHHGSKSSDPEALARWARPKVVLACVGAADNPSSARQRYNAAGARFLATWPDGAVTVRGLPDGLAIETFLSASEWLLPRDPGAE